VSDLHLRSGATVYDIDGAVLLLDREIGRGGEGSVWSIQADQRIAAKFYHKGMDAEHARKVEVMCRLKTESLLKIAAWPTSTLRVKRSGQPAGLLMPRIQGYQPAHLLYSPKSRRTTFPEAQFPFIVHSATNIARAFAAIHDAGQVIGDVNHANLLVSEQATVALIDCDSFEIIDQKSVYPCLVGVPPYTPPELQGKNFRGVRRTQQHDAFGLAVLIFHMLFLGRHPFAGIYRNGTADMTIEQAISEYRFAYSPDRGHTEMEPPPSAPRLADFPPTLSELFLRAFSRSGASGNRASAHEWIPPLETLSKNLKQCVANRSHHFSSHLTTCPWCRVEGMVGIPMFGIKIVIAGAEQFNLSAVWAQIEAILPPSESVPFPNSQNFIGTLAVDVRIVKIVKKRRVKRLMSAAFIAAAITVVLAAQPEPVVSIVILITGLYGMTKLWMSGQAQGKEFTDTHRAATRDYAAGVEEWRRLQGVPSAFTEIKQKLTATRLMFSDIPATRARKMAELNAARREEQLRHFLENHRIEDAVLSNIGKGRKELLRVFNVEDAYDVTLAKISNIKGFGPAMRTTLLMWRMSLEQEFKFDTNKTIDPRAIRALEQELNQKRAEAIRVLTAGPQQLQRSLNSWSAQREHAMKQLNQSAQRLAQTEVDMKALRRW
jgi:DNA-binding helix-hairpin-helix protein with protein kinase domain